MKMDIKVGKFTLIFLVIFLFFQVDTVFARSGCCSHHGGVCGCRCCDGSALSAKCAPYYPSCNSVPVVQQVYPTSTPKPIYPTKTPTKTPTKIPTRSPTKSQPTDTPTPYPTRKPSNTPTPTVTIKQTPTPTNTLTPTSTIVPTDIIYDQQVLGEEDKNDTGGNGSAVGGLALAGGGYMGYKLLKKKKF